MLSNTNCMHMHTIVWVGVLFICLLVLAYQDEGLVYFFVVVICATYSGPSVCLLCAHIYFYNSNDFALSFLFSIRTKRLTAVMKSSMRMCIQSS